MLNSMVYGGYSYSNGFLNPLVTGEPHLVTCLVIYEHYWEIVGYVRTHVFWFNVSTMAGPETSRHNTSHSLYGS